VIDSTGLRFTDDKLDGIREFALPRTKKTLKSFLGLANFFRDHVKNHSMLAKPLQDLVEGYDRKSRNHVVKWTEIGLNAFRDLKEAVAKCQKLYFLDYEKEIFLQTDASDYGVGAYHFQKKEDESHHPVMFISKSFNKVQLRWSVPEKEGYAIHMALSKMEHLLRDTPFILETDHQNLTRIYSSGSPKVLRWQLEFQSFNCQIRHIKGVDNIVADKLSRLCPVADYDEYITPLEEFATTDDDLFHIATTPTSESISEGIGLLAQLSELTDIPAEYLDEIKQVHNEIVGHHGHERTLRKLFRKNAVKK
jgi:hypothetical protein